MKLELKSTPARLLPDDEQKLLAVFADCSASPESCLIIGNEDDPETANILTRVFSGEDWIFFLATPVQMLCLAKNPPGGIRICLLIDIMQSAVPRRRTPVIDGLRMIKMIKASQPPLKVRPPIIVYSALGIEAISDDTMSEGGTFNPDWVASWLTKPLDPQELRTAVKQIVARAYSGDAGQRNSV